MNCILKLGFKITFFMEGVWIMAAKKKAKKKTGKKKK